MSNSVDPEERDSQEGHGSRTEKAFALLLPCTSPQPASPRKEPFSVCFRQAVEGIYSDMCPL